MTSQHDIPAVDHRAHATGRSRTAVLEEIGIADGLLARSNLTKSQLLIWTGQRLHPQIPLYNMVLAFTIEGTLDPAAFRRAFEMLISESDALRTVFDEAHGIPQQRVKERLGYEPEMVDLTTTPNPEEVARVWLDEHIIVRFDLGERLFESALIRLREDRFIWYLNQHHLITDAWSTAVVFRRMAELYSQVETGGPDPGSALPPFRDYVAYERGMRDSKTYEEAEANWREQADRDA